jgi:steroid 5-alpha reductase family enzyme
MIKAYALVVVVYVLAGAAALESGLWWHQHFAAQPLIVAVGVADVAATVVVFIFSIFTRNSSMYDPYWSVAPVPIAIFWLVQAGNNGFANLRHDLIFALVCLWAIRLTANWASQWGGLRHEDWRYQNIHQQTGVFYWPVSFVGIHLMPTIWVFLGSLALWPALSDNATQLTWLDVVAAVVTLGAILIEMTADLQMRRFRRNPAGQLNPGGLWSLSRHPNYFGEVSFWWGLYLFALASQPSYWWVIIGPISMLVLFLFISIPLMENHLMPRHPEYQAYQQRVSAFFPRPSRG